MKIRIELLLLSVTTWSVKSYKGKWTVYRIQFDPTLDLKPNIEYDGLSLAITSKKLYCHLQDIFGHLL